MKYTKVESTDFFDSVNYNSLLSRIQKLTQHTSANWGCMNASQMLHHLNLAIGSGTGIYHLEDKSSLMSRSFNKFLILKVLKRFPKNTQTPSTLKATGTFEFEKEKEQLYLILKKSFETKTDNDWQSHTYFGKMSRQEWGLLIMIHAHHHLRQFDV